LKLTRETVGTLEQKTLDRVLGGNEDTLDRTCLCTLDRTCLCTVTCAPWC
jgi:hypothetical protein